PARPVLPPSGVHRTEHAISVRHLILRVVAGGRLPELEAIPFRIRRPAETAVFRLRNALVHRNARRSELREHRVEVADAVVHHRLLRGRSEVLVVGRRDVPDRDVSRTGGEDRASEAAKLDSQVLRVPRAEPLPIAGADEAAADAGHALHYRDLSEG